MITLVSLQDGCSVLTLCEVVQMLISLHTRRTNLPPLYSTTTTTTTEHFGSTSEIFPLATVLDGYWQHTREEGMTMFATDIPLLLQLPRLLRLFFVKISPFSLDLAFCLVLRLLSSAPGAPGSSFEEIPEQPLVGQIQFFPQLILLFHSITVYVNVHLWH